MNCKLVGFNVFECLCGQMHLSVCLPVSISVCLSLSLLKMSQMVVQHFCFHTCTLQPVLWLHTSQCNILLWGSGSKTAANLKRKKGSASKQAKKQKRDGKQAGHANINDWSSDDSSDVEPAVVQDQLNAMSDRNRIDAGEGAAAHKGEVTSAGKKKRQQGEQQSAGRKKKRKGGVATHGKRKSSGSAKKHAHAKTSDWTSDDSSDAQPETILDELEPMSDSDVDSQGGNRTGPKTATNALHKVASFRGKQSETHVVEKKRHAQPGSTASPSQHDSHRALNEEEEEDWGQPAAMADDNVQPAQQAQLKGRLRKARASPVQARHAAAGNEADDIMVDLEDDVSGLEMEAERYSVARDTADKLPVEDTLEEDLASGQKTQRSSKLADVGGQGSNKEAGKCIGKRQDK